MRRKSERNKAKAGSPEKEVERVTRKSTRKSAKQASSTSLEQENAEETTKSLSNKITEKKSAHIQKKEVEQLEEQNEKVLSIEADVKTKSQEDEEDNNSGSIWKVSRSDASPGEIQRLKLSRQHNTTEGLSDTSLNRKKSNKWQESGEGVAEEVDSADKQLVSSTRVPSSTEQPNDPSSSYPGQDSNEEVSDSKEILPETTSANLSDDKPNIDQQGESNEANYSNENADSKPIKSTSTTILAPSSNGNHSSEETNIMPKEEKSVEDTSEKTVEAFNKETSVENTQRDSSSDEEEDKKEKVRELNSSSESNDEIHTKSNRTGGRIQSASRRKHRTKYRDSSNSDTPDSEDEPSIKRDLEIDVCMQEEKISTEDSHEQKDHTESPKVRNNFLLNNMEMEIEHCEANKQKLDNLVDKSEYTVSATTQLVTYKPVKVNLKRSFSSRMLTEKNDVKKEDTDANANNEASAPNKENHDSTEPDSKCIPRKRRWGTALSTDTAPSFSISTDSLKALVPGARPLSINEVRLSKDDDEDRDRYRVSEKWHNSNEGINDNKSGDENIMQKNGATKKGDPKIDNHIAARRKISIVKEVPHVKSPSPPATKPTNILLIKNLVRPFTLNQIKELLSRTGTIVENGFWMDRIKSKCFVEYANEDQAFETRQALHGISWPVSNPKRLHVEYATKDDMELARELSKDQSIPRKTEPLVPSDSWQQDWNREERTNTKVMVVREWDLGKEDGQQHIKEKEREKKEHDKKRRQRSRSPAVEAHLPAPARKFKKKEDEPPPAKLLDDLFRKTKATPCIYWLPLTNEQIVVKEEMRRQHMAEHARRLEEMRRAERNNRDGRRRRSPRK
ncbi:apoptotic chromatin condensation inducer in the nucleus isoform X1 [Bombus pyrosoma]|uniref:apoptotic chromatin condensation inducer in the nucleus isoform X1 n=1 Tax=Bombus pyrosoma TaxID=396416 RepID=UPI001CB9C426|nr:apoptotic chromatin condensation inducer in the nucleus isoform X1 [Bombus pyrosoma]XP_043579765.1 apoptotic chromatin condensation inducer in the nucleus isoform X1 [Bombus pyrosoma]XP_043579766.1 apoptotic chromatin condensation inducer in the nucleus isoform X1 [Bombus pyrosoma]